MADLWKTQAQQRCLQRTLAALLREAVLPQDALVRAGEDAWLPLDQTGRQLQLVQLPPAGDGTDLWQPLAGIVCHDPQRGVRPIETAAALLRLVAPAIEGVQAGAIERLVQELDNSTDNDALAMAYRHAWGQWLQAHYAASPWRHFLQIVRQMEPAQGLLLLEQWGAQGHPTHPTHKAKLGMSRQQVQAYSPEFGARLQLVLAALRRRSARVTQVPGLPGYVAWFGGHWPQVLQAWRRALRRRGLDEADWLPLPLHPWQAAHSIPQRFASELRQGTLLLLDEVTLAAAPTLSCRTLASEGVAAPHIKVPLSLWLTSAERTVSPKSIVTGPRLTVLLRQILATDEALRQHVQIVDELVGVHYLPPDGNDDVARHLGVLYRRHPATLLASTEQAVPVAALFAPSPLHGRLLVTEAVALAYGDHAEGALAFYAAYVEVALHAVLALHLQYGIALEAHQQNSFIVLDADFRPARLLVRDFGDVRVHAPTLQRLGLQLQAYRHGYTLFDDATFVRDKLLHAFMLCHLLELARALGHAYGQPVQPYVRVLRQLLEQLFERLRPQMDAQRWQTERQALLEQPWPVKSLLRMRLHNSSEDVVLRMPNPLRQA